MWDLLLELVIYQALTITHFTGRIERGDLILTGQCIQCHGEVARVVEGG